jgi:hypothetical protein
MMSKNLILAKTGVNQRFAKAYAISMADLKHEVFDRTILYR